MDNNNYNQINDDLVYVIDEPTSNMQKKRRLSGLSWWLFALAIASIPIALLVMTLWTGAISPKTFTAGWISAVSIPLPVASLIFGLYMKKRGYQYYRNIVIGIIMTFFAVSYTILFTMLCVDTATHDGAAVQRVETKTLIDLPEYYYISTNTPEKSKKEKNRVDVLYNSKVYFENEEAEIFEKDIVADERWLKDTSPNDLMGCMKEIQYDNREAYTIVYNVTTGEFNCPPSQSGEYEFIQMVYIIGYEKVLEIYEYTLTYNK